MGCGASVAGGDANDLTPPASTRRVSQPSLQPRPLRRPSVQRSTAGPSEHDCEAPIEDGPTTPVRRQDNPFATPEHSSPGGVPPLVTRRPSTLRLAVEPDVAEDLRHTAMSPLSANRCGSAADLVIAPKIPVVFRRSSNTTPADAVRARGQRLTPGALVVAAAWRQGKEGAVQRIPTYSTPKGVQLWCADLQALPEPLPCELYDNDDFGESNKYDA